MKRCGANYLGRTTVLLMCLVLGIASAGAKDEGRLGRIEGSKPRYVTKDHEAWASKGRIVGIATEAPDFKVTILSSSKKKVKTCVAEKLKHSRRAYEVWLSPGDYILVVEAEGYDTFDLHGLKVKPRTDLRVDLEFTKR